MPGTPPYNYGPGPAPSQYGLDTLPDQSNAVLRFGNRDELSSRGAYLLGHVEAVEEAGTANVWVIIVAPPLSGRQLWFDALRYLDLDLDLVEKVVTSGIRGSATKVRVQPAHGFDGADMITSPALSVSS